MAPTPPSSHYQIVHTEPGELTGEIYHRTADGCWWVELQSPPPPMPSGQEVAMLYGATPHAR